MFKFGSKKNSKEQSVIYSPCKGEALPLSEVKDITFKEELLGKGVAIIPSEGKVVSPIDGKIEMLFITNHAITIESETGVQILIHIGIDTVNLKGEYYVPHVATGDSVKKGDELITFDIEGIKDAGYDIITPIVILNTNEFEKVEAMKKGETDYLEEIILLEKE